MSSTAPSQAPEEVESPSSQAVVQSYLEDLLTGASRGRTEPVQPSYPKPRAPRKSNIKQESQQTLEQEPKAAVPEVTVSKPSIPDILEAPVSEPTAPEPTVSEPPKMELKRTPAPKASAPEFKPASDFQSSVSAEMAAQLEAKLAAIQTQIEEAPAPEVQSPIVESEKVEAVKAESPTIEDQQEIGDTAVIDAGSGQPPSFVTTEEAWSSQGIECILFDVAGLKLALPLPQLGSVYEIKEDDEVTPLFGQQSWYLGMLKSETSTMQIIDSAEFIMPERNVSLKEQGYQYLIRLNNSPWTLACQGIDETILLQANEIKWRPKRGNRAWLAGTVIEKMCALLDVEGLFELVDSQSKQNAK